MSKDVMWAGAIALGCVMLVVVAVLAPKSKESDPVPSVTETQLNAGPETFGPGPLGGDNGFGPATGSGFGPSGTLSNLPVSGNGPNPLAGPGADNPPLPGFGQSTNLNPPLLPPVVEPTPVASAPVEHVVKAGETLGDISLTYFKTSKQWKKIVEANPGLDPRTIKVGQKLVIPVEPKVDPTTGPAPEVKPGERTYTVRRNDSLYSIARKELGNGARWKEIETLNAGVNTADLKVGQTLRLPGEPVTSATALGGTEPTAGKTHVVAKGETLADISKKYFGTTQKWKDIAKANPGSSPENLKIGQKIVIPDVGSSTAQATNARAGTYTIKAGDTIRNIARTQLGDEKRWKELLDANPGINPKGLRAGQAINLPIKADATEAAPLLPVLPATSPITEPFGPVPPAVQPFGAPAPTSQPFGAPTATSQPFGAPANPVQPAPFSGTGGMTPPPASDFATPYPAFGEPAPVAPIR